MNTHDSIDRVHEIATRLLGEMEQVVFGQRPALTLLLTGLFAGGHMLIEGLPGTAKTTMVKSLAQLLSLDFKRIQLTPDMLPSEISGTHVYDLAGKNFSFRPGPVFTDLLLADEINRTPPKTQSALLEAMEEQQVSADGTRHALSEVFTVIATLNPIEFEGTYPLPEAQLDRFLLKIPVGYPEPAAEKQMLAALMRQSDLKTRPLYAQHAPVADKAEIIACRKAVTGVAVDEAMLDYMLSIVADTRHNPNVQLGCSPRAALALLSAARAFAAIEGKAFVTPDHVKAVAGAVLKHRMILSADAELDGLTLDHVMRQTLGKIAVPR